MARVTNIKVARRLTGRRTITFDLPEFLICAFEARAEDANTQPGKDSEEVTVANLVELQMAEALSIAEVALLARIPGISAAVSEWLRDID